MARLTHEQRRMLRNKIWGIKEAAEQAFIKTLPVDLKKERDALELAEQERQIDEGEAYCVYEPGIICRWAIVFNDVFIRRVTKAANAQIVARSKRFDEWQEEANNLVQGLLFNLEFSGNITEVTDALNDLTKALAKL